MVNVVSYQQPAPVVVPAAPSAPNSNQQPVPTVAAQTKPVPPSAPSNNPKPTSMSTQRIHDGLKGVATTTGQIADRILAHPAEMNAEIEMAQEVHTQYGEIIRTASGIYEENEKLQGAVSEIQKTEEWLGDQCGGGIQNTSANNVGAGILTFNSLQDLVRQSGAIK